jgi:hypothetical protein
MASPPGRHCLILPADPRPRKVVSRPDKGHITRKQSVSGAQAAEKTPLTCDGVP